MESIEGTEASDDAFYAAIVESSAEAITGHRLNGTIVTWNPGASDLYGYSAEEMRGSTLARLVPEGREDIVPALLTRALAGARTEQGEADCVHRTKAGAEIDVALTVSVIRSADGDVLGASIIARDISDRKRLERRLAQLASEDDLTGLANRRRFHEELAAHLNRAARYGYRGAVLLLDLDKIKTINDTLGHGAGDQLIRRAAGLLSRRLRESDLFARLGGDEFGVLLPDADANRAEFVAETLVEALRRADMATTSIGMAVIAEPMSAEEVMIRADIAMYAVKDRGGDGAASYSSAIDARFTEEGSVDG